VIRDEDHKKELVLRLRRVEGQLRGIQAMIDEGADCEKVTQQLSAARRALDKAFFQVLACAIQAGPEGTQGSAKGAQASAKGAAASERLEHAAALLAKFG
jgi:DNA-binding FrmR family transcriptional regulator